MVGTPRCERGQKTFLEQISRLNEKTDDGQCRSDMSRQNLLIPLGVRRWIACFSNECTSEKTIVRASEEMSTRLLMEIGRGDVKIEIDGDGDRKLSVMDSGRLRPDLHLSTEIKKEA